MKIIVDGLNITYKKIGSQNGKYVLLLHGWGGNLNSFRFLCDYLAGERFGVVCLDFPGFGGSDVPPETFCLKDYCNVVKKVLEAEKIDKVSIVAHSFGGRIAILLASENAELVDRLVLVDSAGLKPKFSITKWARVCYYKFLKSLKKAKIINRDLSGFGSEDYKALPQNLRPVFNNIIKTDLSKNLKDISCPTLIVWGRQDKDTPYYMAKKLKKGIKDSAIVTFDGGHFAYLQNSQKFSIIVNQFLK